LGIYDTCHCGEGGRSVSVPVLPFKTEMSMSKGMESPGLLQRADGLLTAEVGEELLMMSVEQGRYFNLNSVGARIWELLATPMTTAGLMEALTAEYDVDPATALSQIEGFVGALRERGLLVADDAAAA
jgi:hypothetical protein